MSPLVFASLVATSSSALPVPPTRVLVIPTTTESPGDLPIAKLVDEAILVELGKKSGLFVTSQAELEVTVGEARKKQLLGCEGCDLELAEAAKVERVVRGQVGRIGDTFILTLSMIDGARGVAVSRASEIARRREDLRSAAAAAVEAMVGGADAARFRLAGSGVRRLAVLELEAIDVETEVAKNLTDVIAVRLSEIEGIEIMTWKDVQAILAVEKTRQLLGCEDELACMAEIGGALGADGFIAGHVGRIGDTHVIGLRLVDPASARVLSRVTESFLGDVNQIVRACRYAVGELVGLPRKGSGKVTIVSDASDGKVLLDGTELELAGFGPSVVEGKHLLRIEADDYLPWISDIYVESDEARLVASLTRRPSEWFEEWWFWTIVAGTVVAAGAGTTAFLLSRNQGGALEIGAENPGAL